MKQLQNGTGNNVGSNRNASPEIRPAIVRRWLQASGENYHRRTADDAPLIWRRFLHSDKAMIDVCAQMMLNGNVEPISRARIVTRMAATMLWPCDLLSRPADYQPA